MLLLSLHNYLFQIYFILELNIYNLQHVLQKFIYFTKIYSENIYFKNTPPPPPPR